MVAKLESGSIMNAALNYKNLLLDSSDNENDRIVAWQFLLNNVNCVNFV